MANPCCLQGCYFQNPANGETAVHNLRPYSKCGFGGTEDAENIIYIDRRLGAEGGAF